MLDRSSLTISSIRDGLQGKSFSARELVQEYLSAIEANKLNSFLHVDREGALKQADAVDAKLASGSTLPLLAAVPVAVKDVLLVPGMPATASSAILKGYMPPYAATSVARLQAEHAIVMGKTNCDEFAMGSSGEYSAYGATQNPWDRTKVPGGSSSGSAAAVAAGESVVALGTDTGGSIRQPAGFCGVVGLKPTYGRVSRYGLMAFASSLDHVGPITRTVEDAAIVLSVMAGKDPQDATSVDRPAINLEAIAGMDVKGMRIGLPKEYFIDGLDAQVEQSVRDVATLLKSKGAVLVDVSLPLTEYALAVYYVIQPAEASSNLARYDGIRFGPRAEAHDLFETYMQTRAKGFGAEVKRRIMLGTYALSSGYYDAYYKQAQKVRTLIRDEFAKVFESVNVLLTPTSPTTPFAIGERQADPLQMYLADAFTVPADIAGVPAISIPSGFAEDLPIGTQFIGPMWAEERLLGLAKVVEQELALPLRLPPIA